MIDKLAFPSRHGGSAADAFDLVIPSLPGFGFSSKPARPFGQRGTARLFNALMTQVLGYDRYLAQGGDWGGLITSCLGYDHAAHVQAIHLNMIGFRPPGGPKTAGGEPAWAGGREARMNMLGAYFRLQMSKPQSLAWLGAGNPVGQAAWIVERFYDWCDRGAKPFEQVFSLDALLTNVMIYVMTGSFTTGAWYYRALDRRGGRTAEGGRALRDADRLRQLPGRGALQGPAAALRRARLQHHPLDRSAARRPLRRHGGAGPVRGRRARPGRRSSRSFRR